MAQRFEPLNSLDNFPTPPWASRALLEKVLGHIEFKSLSCLEPACGAGPMSKVLKEYFSRVYSSDLHNYGFGEEVDFLSGKFKSESFDWVVTNPPFKLAESFITEARRVAKCGVGMFVRTTFLESIGRYHRIFEHSPPTYVAQFSERVPLVKGRLDKKATTATGYAWYIWEGSINQETKLRWIEPCRKNLEKPGDYLEPISSMY
jgi:hypothetical protein